MAPKICLFNKFGYCRFGKKCSSPHNNTLCKTNQCPIWNCEKRHPIKCRYFESFRMCKFTTFCKYSHEIESIVNVLDDEVKNSKIAILEKSLTDLRINFQLISKQIANIEEQIHFKDSEIEILSDKLKSKENRNPLTMKLEDKVIELNEKIEFFEEALKKKSDEVDHLSEGMDFLVEHFRKENKHIYQNIYCEKCKTKVRLTNSLYLPFHMQEVHRIFKCNECDYTAESERARQYHMKTDHKK